MFNLFYKNSLLQGNLAAVLIIMMVFLAGGWVLLYPKPAQAAWADWIGGPANIWANIRDAAKWAWEKVQAAYAYAADKIKTAIALWQKSDALLARVTRVAATIALHTLLNMLTNEIIKWIQGGGEPRFITDWRSFLSEAGDKAGGLFVDKYLGAGWLCEPFDIDIKIALLRVPTFDETVRCTITDILDNINDFYNDFRVGGWPAWLELTQPQNNLYGAYWIAHDVKVRVEDAAEQAAENEGITGRGFLSVKVCVKGKVVNNFDQSVYRTCNNTGDCKSAKDSVADDIDYSFVCEKEKVSTPASVLSDVTSRAMDREMDTLSREISAMTADLGTYAPYVVAIGNALINRLIQEGLEQIQTTGPTVESPDEPLPPSDLIISIDSPAEAEVAAEIATMVLEQQELLKENLETQLRPQQQSNLAVTQNIETIQINILNTLLAIFRTAGCSLPSWANSQMTDSWTEPSSDPLLESDREIEIFQFTPPNIGSISIKKTAYRAWSDCASEDDEGNCISGWASLILYESLEINPQISSQISALEADIETTYQRITNIDTAIASTNGLFQTVDEYIALYDAIHPSLEGSVPSLGYPTEEEQAALDTAEDNIEIALELLISDGRIAVESSADDMMELSNDTQEFSMMINLTANSLLETLGLTPEFPQEDTLYAQRNSLQVNLSDAQTIYSRCTAPEEEAPAP